MQIQKRMKFNSFSNKKISLDLSKSRKSVDNNFDEAQMAKFVFDRAENIMGKGSLLPAFSPFPAIVSKKLLFQSS